MSSIPRAALLAAFCLTALPSQAVFAQTPPPAETQAPAASEEGPAVAPPAARGEAAQPTAPDTGNAVPPDAVQSPSVPEAQNAAPDEAGQPAASAAPAQPGYAVDQATLPHDLSPWGMFMAADIVVKAVMIGLAFASVVTWTVWLAKTLEILGAKARVRRAARIVSAADSLDAAAQGVVRHRGAATGLVRAASEEARLSADILHHAPGEGVKERVVSRLSRLEAAAGRRMARGTGVLATIGSTAPFVGLLGTVWGIMNSFIGISEAQTTNLAVVAPGIAEALLATAIGLVAAIPAVIIYNVFARSIAAYRAQLADVSAAILRLVSRDLDRRHVPLAQAAE